MYQLILLRDVKNPVVGIKIDEYVVTAIKINNSLINTVFTGDISKPFFTADDIASIICDYLAQKFVKVKSIDLGDYNTDKNTIFYKEKYIYRGKHGTIQFHIKAVSGFLVVDSVTCDIKYTVKG